MKKFKEDETFLARWVENKLSAEELSDFQSEEEFELFNKINKEVSSFSVKSANLEADYNTIKHKIAPKSKVRKLARFYYAAASIIILIGLFQFVNSSKTIVADFGEKMLAELPDGSKVQLNAGSKIKYKRFFWESNREVNLQGEAYFDVVKGDTKFTVISESGYVEVLGTQFNIIDRKERFKVVCYSGKVAVNQTDSSKQYILTEGDAIQIYKNQISSTKTIANKPDWIQGISIFKNEAFTLVLEALERQYNAKIEVNNVDVSKRFTGSFVHNNLDTALQTTIPVMGITYKVSKDKKVIYLE